MHIINYLSLTFINIIKNLDSDINSIECIDIIMMSSFFSVGHPFLEQ